MKPLRLVRGRTEVFSRVIRSHVRSLTLGKEDQKHPVQGLQPASRKPETP